MRKSIILMLTYINLTLLLSFPATPVIAQTDFWEETGLTDVSVVALAINNNGDIFAGTEIPGSSAGGTVFRSSDNGDNWTPTGLTETIATLAINASGDIFAGATGSHLMFRSTDNGDNWTRIDNGLGNAGVQALAISASGDIFAGTVFIDGVFRSTDNGDSWTQTGLSNRVSALAINASGDIFAGSDGVVFRSSDRGDNWTQIDLGLTGFNPVQAFAFNSNGDIFTGTLNSGVLRSTDNGDNWTQTGLTRTPVLALAINSNGDIFAGTLNGGVFRSTNNGDNWSQINTGLTSTTVYALAINRNNGIFAGTFGGGVFRHVESPTAGDIALSDDALEFGAVFIGASVTRVLKVYNRGTEELTVNDISSDNFDYTVDLASFSLAAGDSQNVAVTFMPSTAGERVGILTLTSNDPDESVVTVALRGEGQLPSPETGFWQQTNGPFGGDVNAIALNSNGHIFVGTDGGGVFRSVNNGDNWSRMNNGLADLRAGRAGSLAINSDDVIYAALGDGLFRSLDNGENWARVDFDLGIGGPFTSVVINSSDDIFVAGRGFGGGTVIRSTDNGENWADIASLGFNIETFAFNSSGDIFAGTAGAGIFRSTNNGDNWMQVNDGLTSLGIQALAINANNDVFVGTRSGIFRSTNNGDNWVEINAGLTNPEVFSLAVNSSGHIFAGTGNLSSSISDQGTIFRSTDNGENWTQVFLPKCNVLSFAFNANDEIFAGTEGCDGIYRSADNGNNWEPVNNGLTNTYVSTLLANSAGDIFAGTYLSGLFISTDSGENWIAANNGLTDNYILSLAINSEGHIYAGTFVGGVFRSTDNANTWNQINNGLPIPSQVRSLAINANGHIFAGTGCCGVFRSTDSGENWTQINSGFTRTNFNVEALAINSNGDIFATMAFGGGVFRSTDNGDNWTQSGLQSNTILSLAINPNGHIFAGADFLGSVFRSTDNGDNWTDSSNITGGFVANVEALAINSDGQIFAVAFQTFFNLDDGIYVSSDNGDNWTQLNSGLGASTSIKSLAISRDGFVFAGTRGSGVFRSVQTTTSVEEITGEIPTSFSLEQNYPNPFNPSTTIQFTVEKSSHVILKLFDITGREVTMLVDETFTPGSYSTVFEADGLPSGIYFYRITAGEFMQTKKLTLLK